MKLKRLFNTSDSKMLEEIRFMRAHFEKNLAAFTAQDPSLNITFLNNWNAAKEEAFDIEGDSLETNEGRELLEESVSALGKCQVKYTQVKYFAGKAFPKNKEAMKEFGEGQYSKIRNSPLRMVQFMETLHGVATKYKTELLAQEYTQAAIDEIATLTDELRQDNKLQQLKKKERPTKTRNRIEIMNTFYGFGQRVASVAPLVFANDAVSRRIYVLSPNQQAKVKRTWWMLEPAALRKISLPKMLKQFTATLTNQGTEPVDYWRANNIKEKPAQKQQLATGEMISIEVEEPVKKFLIVQNTSAKAVRLMLVKEKREVK